MAKTKEFGDDFLNQAGGEIFELLVSHCNAYGMMDVDRLELAMLANSFCLYAESAKVCMEDGISMTIITEKGGKYSQIRPEYTVMKNEYQNILKHSAKFGMNPADRARVFSKIDRKPEKKGFDTGVMKLAK